MALIRADIFSECLMRTVTIHAIIPADKPVFPGMPAREEKPFKTLYLLHGIFGNDTDWMSGTRIERWAKDANLAVIMPAGENKFYVDNEASGDRYGEFIGRELVALTRKLFPLSDRREDTYIAGLSMGGYGAIVNGLKYPDTFSHVAGLSSGLILEGVITSKDGAAMRTHNRSYYQSVFGDLDKLIGSDKDYKALVRKLQEEKKELPKLYLTCGTEDFLLEANRDYRDFLQENQVDFTYVEAPGSHEWDFWDTHIKKVLEWLPLERAYQGISSGNVR